MTSPDPEPVTSHDTEPIPLATREAIRAAIGIAGAVQDFRVDVRALKMQARVNRLLIVLLALSFAFSLHQSINARRAADQAGRAADQAASATTTAALSAQRDQATCESVNLGRRENRALWDYLLSIVTPPQDITPEAAASQAEVAEKFNIYLSRAFVQRDCSAPVPAPLIPEAPYVQAPR